MAHLLWLVNRGVVVSPCLRMTSDSWCVDEEKEPSRSKLVVELKVATMSTQAGIWWREFRKAAGPE